MRLDPTHPSPSSAAIAVLLATATALALAGGAAAQPDRHRTYADAPTDDGIFYAIPANASLQAADLAEAAEASIRSDGQPASPTVDAVESAASKLDALAGGFTDELLEVIEAQGTAPPRLSALHEAIIALNEAGQGLASADVERQQAVANASLADEEAPDPDEEPALVGAVEALEEERAAVGQLQDAADALEAEGIDASALRTAASALDERLLAQREVLEDALVLLDVPALLTLSVDDPSVAFGDRVTASGLALAGGDPAAGDEVTVRFAGETTTAAVAEDGRYRASIPVPEDLPAGTHPVAAEAQINGTSVSAGPSTVDVEPMTPRLTLEPATTVMAERGNLSMEGRLDLSPLATGANETVEVTYRGDPVLEATTGPEGRFEALLDVTPLLGGPSTLQARWTADDPRMTDASSQPVSVFVPYTELQRQARAQGSDPVYEEFDFPSTGLGPVPDILAGITLLGLVVLVSNAALARGGSALSVEGITRRIRFTRLTTFEIATEEDKYHADPRNAFPPLDASDRDVGELYEAFVDGVRGFESVPPSATHRDLAAYLRAEGVPDHEARDLARWYEAARYHPRDRVDEAQVRQAFERAWEGFVRTRDIDGNPWPRVGR